MSTLSNKLTAFLEKPVSLLFANSPASQAFQFRLHCADGYWSPYPAFTVQIHCADVYWLIRRKMKLNLLPISCQ